jgi:hypothetical protein
VFDARALRVIVDVDDEGGGSLQHSIITHAHSTLATCAQVFDARALRVIVDDEGGSRSRDAVETCYKLVSTVHSIWKPVPHVSEAVLAAIVTSQPFQSIIQLACTVQFVWRPVPHVSAAVLPAIVTSQPFLPIIRLVCTVHFLWKPVPHVSAAVLPAIVTS